MKPRIHRPADGAEPPVSVIGGGLSNRNNLRVRFQPEEQTANSSWGLVRLFSGRLVSLCFPNDRDGKAKHVLVGKSDDANDPNRINKLATEIANGTVDKAILLLNKCDPAKLFELLIRIREIQPQVLQDILNELDDSHAQLKLYLVHIMYDPSWGNIVSEPQDPSEI
jgi:hypothetical protein